jgi:UDP-3-O-[3-hydroxymyristoyl] glucosamine N-acyltransferase
MVVENINKALIAAMELFAPKLTGFNGIHPTAVVEPTADVDKTAAVGSGAYISHGVKIGAYTVIGPGCTIGENTVIGMRCSLDSNVVVYHNCQIGNFCIIQANSTIGSTGFGYSFIEGQHRLIPHNGGVILEDGVEIGANSCVDRAKFGNTIIGAGTKIDNLVQIAHNAHIGKLCLFAGQSGVAGSVTIGNGVVFAGQSGVIDNKTVGDGAVIGVKSAAIKDIPAGQTVLGMPPQDSQRELRCINIYQRLPELAKEVKQLVQKVEQLESAKDH